MTTKIESFILRYCRTILSAEFLNVAVVVHAPGVGFCDMRIRHDWKSLSVLDPDADVPMLRALLREMQQSLRNPAECDTVLTDLKQVFSNLIQSSEPREYFIEVDPASELERLSRQTLEGKRATHRNRTMMVRAADDKDWPLGREAIEKARTTHWLM